MMSTSHRPWLHPYRRRGWIPIVLAAATISVGFVSQSLFLTIGFAVATLIATVVFRQALAELLSMPVLRWFFRMRSVGPGIEQFPMTGPVLVIANHASIFDPPIMTHELPRAVTGVMTSVFYDRWFFYLLSRGIWDIIRVPDSSLKTDTPEIDAIVAALDRGKCVLLFPEGWLRRKEEVPLRRFGQGIWRVLSQRPNTPIVPCWLEGTWGSRFSHKDGPPGGAKPRDRGRPIDLGFGAPFTVPSEVLADQLKTRFYLMDHVAGCRSFLGLEPLPKTQAVD